IMTGAQAAVTASGSANYVQQLGQPHAAGGSFLIPQSYGNEGFRMGNGDTASAGETVTITPKGGGDMSTIAAAIANSRI
ncbi:hypothetical protein, partial [Streptococcus pseudopneumoniae]|uniref:hypothetical protein n=1 Tax=Streptococcus pseudopneumoniae TaxID=257758 RepID=UPI0019D529D0